MTTQVTVWFHGVDPPTKEAVFELDQDGKAICSYGDDMRFLEGITPPFSDRDVKPVMPDEGEKFLETVLTFNRNASYVSYEDTSDKKES